MWVSGVVGGLGIALAVGTAASAQEPPAPLTCLLEPARESKIGSDHIGLIRSVNVRRADHVEAGDVLVELDPAMVEAEIRLNQVAIDDLRARIARTEVLGARKLIAQDEIEQMKTELRIAEATLAKTQTELAKTRILAPFDGVVADVFVAEGELTGTEPLIRLTETRTLKAGMVFVDSAFGQFTTGQSVTLVLPLTGAKVTAQITAIDPFLDPASNTFRVTAELANEDGAIPAGIACAFSGRGA